uniref:Uncharacterized protein n=1 Tax=Pelusios castaneus TaxID=367368 RepID=A0A8C8RQI7_9SAUR
MRKGLSFIAAAYNLRRSVLTLFRTPGESLSLCASCGPSFLSHFSTLHPFLFRCAGWGDLAAVLRTNQRLTELDLKWNPLGDSGVRRLCEGLKHPNCKLQRLRLIGCRLKDTCGRDLASVLRTQQSLTELEMCGNCHLRDTAVQQLCQGLKHPNCKLQRLTLNDCDLTDAACGALSSVLSSSETLTELDLVRNKLGDSGVQLLCEGLKHPNCKLQILKLSLCKLTAACSGDLTSALSTNQSLRELEIGAHTLGDSGLRLLSEGLKHPNCKLQKLGFCGCHLKAACCEDLSSILYAKETLVELRLTGNNLGDSGVKLLCEGLKHANCKLQKLGLKACELSAGCCGELSSALSTNPLTDLDLSDNKLGGLGIQLLCEGLKHPNCKLQRLGLRFCSLLSGSCEDLTMVLCTSQSLTELDLSYNFSLGDAGIQLLCEGLKHPNCKLQILE